MFTHGRTKASREVNRLVM